MFILSALRTAISMVGRLAATGLKSSIVKTSISNTGTALTNIINEKIPETLQQNSNTQQPQQTTSSLARTGAALLQIIGIPLLSYELVLAIFLVGVIVVVMVMSYFSILDAAPFPTNIK